MTTVSVDPETGEILDIDGDLPEERALTVREPAGHVMSGVGAIARLSDAEFEANLATIALGVRRAARMQDALLVAGTDYGAVPNVKRPFLHKPGAEKFEKAYGLATRFVLDRMTGDGVTAPPLQFVAHAYVHLGDFGGPVVAEGIGEANAWETKYRYRSAERTCPKCGAAAIKSGTKRDSTEREFYCWAKAGGCGARFDANDPAIVGQEAGKVDNPDPWDLANTLAKMATKRAHVDGILRATGTSGLFTQDDDSPAVPRPAPTPAPARSSSRAEAPAPAAPPPGAAGVTLIGRPGIGKAPADGELRETPDGPCFGFALLEPTGKRIQVVAFDRLADDLVIRRDDLLAADRVTVAGTLRLIPWQKDGKDMPPYRQLIAERVSFAGEEYPTEDDHAADLFPADSQR